MNEPEKLESGAREDAAAPALKTRKAQPRPYKPEDWEVELDTLRATLAARDAALQACQVEQEALIVQGHEALSAHADKAAADLRACQEERDDLQRKCSEAFDSEVLTARRVLQAERALSDTVQALQAICDDVVGLGPDPLWIVRRELITDALTLLARLRATLAPQDDK